MCFCCLQDKTWIKVPKQTIFLETPVFLFSLLRIFDGIFDVIIDHPYLTYLVKRLCYCIAYESWLQNLKFEIPVTLFASLNVQYMRNWSHFNSPRFRCGSWYANLKWFLLDINATLSEWPNEYSCLKLFMQSYVYYTIYNAL